ncbi:hypothetical protein [Teredinibacter franksiae]|uniref:hypothetical protein n=1 Tax=Teredinibacter franksiae TaxID=2761453 RepID=UPI0016266E99|nr:hypothetical protein [Teredinibacter franksiae]
MRKRIPANLLNRVDKLEEQRRTEKVRPVMMVPRLVHVDQWGELAANMQAILKDNVVKGSAPDYGDLSKLELVATR